MLQLGRELHSYSQMFSIFISMWLTALTISAYVIAEATEERPWVCTIGAVPWDRNRIKQELDDFRSVYDLRPQKVSKQGSNLFHAFAQWCMIKMLKPKYIIESGTLLGWGSYLMRHAAGPDTHFVYISPHSPEKTSTMRSNASYWDDPGSATKLYGDKFRDFSEVDWNQIGLDSNEKRASSLIYFDDHQAGYRRLVEAQQARFQHIMYDDGYPYMGDNFSLKQACDVKADFYRVHHAITRHSLITPPESDKFSPAKLVPYFDNFASIKYEINMDTKKCLYDSMMSRVDTYLEFPELWSGTFRGKTSYNLQDMYMRPLLTEEEGKQFVKGFKKMTISMEREAAGYSFVTYAKIKDCSNVKIEKESCMASANLVYNRAGEIH